MYNSGSGIIITKIPREGRKKLLIDHIIMILKAMTIVPERTKGGIHL